MTGGSCLTFQLPTPSRQQLHPRAWRELGPGQCGDSGAASQALPVWVSLAWEGATGRPSGVGQGGRHPCTTAPCSLPTFCNPWGLQPAQSAWAVSLGWDSGRVSGSCASSPASYADGAFLRGCGKSEASVHPLPVMGPLPAHRRPGRLSQQPAAEERPLQAVCPRAGSGGCSCLTPPSCFPSQQQCPRLCFPSLGHPSPTPPCSVGWRWQQGLSSSGSGFITLPEAPGQSTEHTTPMGPSSPHPQSAGQQDGVMERDS